jgi:hypothetical protein
MVVPRGWSALEKQRSPDQTLQIAKPMATDIRFKTAAFLLFISWVVTVFSLLHSIWHYKLERKSPGHLIIGIFKYTPLKYALMLPLALVMVGYEAAIAFDFDISPLKLHGTTSYMYGLGWTPILLIFVVMEIYGYVDPNEDRELIRQRRIRGAEIDRELGITKKPHWWSRLHGDHNLNVHDMIAKNAKEIGGGKATTKNLESSIEMGNMPVSQRRGSSKIEASDAMRLAAGLLFPTPSGTSERSDPFSDSHARDRSRSRGRGGNGAAPSARVAMSDRSESTASGVTLNAPPQKIKSMLDI